ncbi:hypothetical protein [Arhodomonas sp. SL1]|uniref:hypothetical protein n=1 Tax=Arhodomonas sp. SL1 TaxID=3425691 RepID=UPI003F88523F
MDRAQPGDCRRFASQTAVINPLLDRYVRPGLKLKIALGRIIAVVTFESAFDIDRMGVMASIRLL